MNIARKAKITVEVLTEKKLQEIIPTAPQFCNYKTAIQEIKKIKTKKKRREVFMRKEKIMYKSGEFHLCK